MYTTKQEEFKFQGKDNVTVTQEPDQMDETVKLYHEFLDAYEEVENKIKNINGLYSEYTKEYQAKIIDDLRAELDKKREKVGNQILDIIDERIKNAQDERKLKEHYPNYEMMLNNALSMLKMLEDSITADQANNILAPFIEQEEWQTISIIQTYLRKLNLPEGTYSKINFVEETLISEEARHQKMKDVYLDIFFKRSVKYMNSLEGIVAIQVVGTECGYFTRGEMIAEGVN